MKLLIFTLVFCTTLQLKAQTQKPAADESATKYTTDLKVDAPQLEKGLLSEPDYSGVSQGQEAIDKELAVKNARASERVLRFTAQLKECARAPSSAEAKRCRARVMESKKSSGTKD